VSVAMEPGKVFLIAGLDQDIERERAVVAGAIAPVPQTIRVRAFSEERDLAVRLDGLARFVTSRLSHGRGLRDFRMNVCRDLQPVNGKAFMPDEPEL